MRGEVRCLARAAALPRRAPGANDGVSLAFRHHVALWPPREPVPPPSPSSPSSPSSTGDTRWADLDGLAAPSRCRVDGTGFGALAVTGPAAGDVTPCPRRSLVGDGSDATSGKTLDSWRGTNTRAGPALRCPCRCRAVGDHPPLLEGESGPCALPTVAAHESRGRRGGGDCDADRGRGRGRGLLTPSRNGRNAEPWPRTAEDVDRCRCCCCCCCALLGGDAEDPGEGDAAEARRRGLGDFVGVGEAEYSLSSSRSTARSRLDCDDAAALSRS